VLGAIFEQATISIADRLAFLALLVCAV